MVILTLQVKTEFEFGEHREFGCPPNSVRPFTRCSWISLFPGLGGKETVERQLAMDPGVRAIVSGGYANDPIMADFRRYGFRGVAPKRYNMKELAIALESVLKDRDLGY